MVYMFFNCSVIPKQEINKKEIQIIRIGHALLVMSYSDSGTFDKLIFSKDRWASTVAFLMHKKEGR